MLVAGIQARLPDSGTSIDGAGLAAALQRINALHDDFPGATNSMGKFWAYTNSNLGQVDTTVVADTASYGVFKNGSKRTLVAYNPTNSQIVVTFTDTLTGVKRTLSVPALSMATDFGTGQPYMDTLARPTRDTQRLYFEVRVILRLSRGVGCLHLPNAIPC